MYRRHEKLGLPRYAKNGNLIQGVLLPILLKNLFFQGEVVHAEALSREWPIPLNTKKWAYPPPKLSQPWSLACLVAYNLFRPSEEPLA